MYIEPRSLENARNLKIMKFNLFQDNRTIIIIISENENVCNCSKRYVFPLFPTGMIKRSYS